MTISRKAWFVATSLEGQDEPLYQIKASKSSLREVLPSSNSMRYSKVHRPSGAPKRDHITNTKEYYAKPVNEFGALKTMALNFGNVCRGTYYILVADFLASKQ